MTALARRLAALAAIALVGAVGVIALTRIDEGEEAERRAPPPPVATTLAWETARVGALATAEDASGCPTPVSAETAGVVHPVLPCGARLVLEHAGRHAEVEVVARQPVAAGHAFDLTPALATRLGLAVETDIRWRFAG